ncbi:hypothetical protein ASG52_19810 [Methylobacterium sp. Leaf456]|uniref:hypothetical protein n=1 Tax=Methylobacterium sp. Leaf456 TaxID=1736382 RepID=UPI0006F8FA1F|nr:hypothetical protein [Methylobacterium sp. Leaf456]KQT59974.1 hypothetical protein ASG52_19810 [Methylobacterium sp. Leaf456]
MRAPSVQHFEVVVNGTAIGSVTQLPSGDWFGDVGGERRLGPYRTPTEARAAVVARSEAQAAARDTKPGTGPDA